MIDLKPKRIYLASSWRNKRQPYLCAKLRTLDHEVYDFRHPANASGFSWDQIDEAWKSWTVEEYRKALQTKRASDGFASDFKAMSWADTCVLLLPSGRSAHSEAGWMCGKGKRVFVRMDSGEEPELMYLMFDGIFGTDEELFEALKH